MEHYSELQQKAGRISANGSWVAKSVVYHSTRIANDTAYWVNSRAAPGCYSSVLYILDSGTTDEDPLRAAIAIAEQAYNRTYEAAYAAAYEVLYGVAYDDNFDEALKAARMLACEKAEQAAQHALNDRR